MSMRMFFGFTVMASVLTATGAFTNGLAADAKPAIHITQPAPWGVGGEGPMAQIAGTVEAPPPGSVVHVFCFAGGQWWIQPWGTDNTLRIKGARWSTSTHLGETYAAPLTSAAWRAPATAGDLPPVNGDIFAKDIVAGKR